MISERRKKPVWNFLINNISTFLVMCIAFAIYLMNGISWSSVALMVLVLVFGLSCLVEGSFRYGRS